MDVAEDGSGDGSENGTSTPTKKEAIMIMPTPTNSEASMTLPTSTEREACNLSPTPTPEEGSMLPETCTDSKQLGTHNPDQQVTPSNNICSSDNHSADEDHVSSFLEWLHLNADWKRMLDNETTMLVCHDSKLGGGTKP